MVDKRPSKDIALSPTETTGFKKKTGRRGTQRESNRCKH